MNNNIKIYCINLVDSSRQSYVNPLFHCERIEAVDTRLNPDICVGYGLTISPVNSTLKVLLETCPGTIGCYLSHYKIWQKIVKENISQALILEDDADFLDVDKFLQQDLSLLKYENYDLVQLNKRPKHRHGKLFTGSESYILNNESAKKLIKLTHEPILLKNVAAGDAPNVLKFFEDNPSAKPIVPKYPKMSIICPVDVFMAMSCDKNVDKNIRLTCLLSEHIGLNKLYSKKSNIISEIPVWRMTQSMLSRYLK